MMIFKVLNLVGAQATTYWRLLYQLSQMWAKKRFVIEKLTIIFENEDVIIE
jgi:lipid-A-disaccharide synthase-like uncharacterized protein